MPRPFVPVIFAARNQLWWAAYWGAARLAGSLTRSANPIRPSTAQCLAAPVGGYTTPVKEAIMPRSNVVPLRAQNPQYAQELINSIQPKNFTLEELNVIVGDLPRDLQAVISLVSSEFDHFDKSRRSSSFIAMRLLAMIAANISHALENPHV
jgi:hypothetical protein